MQTKKIMRILTLAIAVVSLTTLASIPCPSQVTCAKDNYTSCYVAGPNWKIDPMNTPPTLPPGTYTFFLAAGQMKNDFGWCAYINRSTCKDGSCTTLAIVSTTYSRPDLKTGIWQWDSAHTEASCNTSASLCPFDFYLDQFAKENN